ncbi:MAG: formate dehydrogenase accessory sulfurtransferase FdhD [Anaerolineales bacterium]|nr:formate dehydrogenase accessory sulfurtransferase FdhD [Anaerolineales bacterium]
MGNNLLEGFDGAKPIRYFSVGIGEPHEVDDEIVVEAHACIIVNGHELATFMCTPHQLDWLGVGFLYNESILTHANEIATLHVSDSHCVEIWLNHSFTPPERLIVTAGCSGGVTFDDLSKQHAPLPADDVHVSPETLAELMRQLHLGAKLYQRSRGIHTAVLATPSATLLQVEDLGRHNCLDKLAGAALLQGLDTSGHILLSSGRISSEMINKARRMSTPIVCSRTSPTSLSVALAEAWNITLVAYLRQDRMRIYTHPERVL